MHNAEGWSLCGFGMYQEVAGIPTLVKKPTTFMTNADEVGKILSEKCSGDHHHVHLLNGRAKRAEIYPDEMCYRILRGLLDQMRTWRF